METATIFIDRQIKIWVRDTYIVESPSQELLKATIISNQDSLLDILALSDETSLGKVKFKFEEQDELGITDTPALNVEGIPVYKVSLEENNEVLIDTQYGDI